MSVSARRAQVLLDQLSWHYDNHVAPRLAGLTDAEYLWEPVANCWSIRPRGQPRSAMAAGGGDLVLDFAHPEPDPPPFTTVAWRLAHVAIGVFGMRNAAHFDGSAIDFRTAIYPATAAAALAELDAHYRRRVAGVSSLDEDALSEVVGPADPGARYFFPEATMAELILHTHREAIHHLAEVLLLRDLYRGQRH